MTAKTRTVFKADKDVAFADNTTKNITPAIHRAQLDHLADSVLFPGDPLPAGTALATTGTVNLDFADISGQLKVITATGDITFTTSNLAFGRHVTLCLIGSATTRTLAYPAGWVALGSALPTSLGDETLMISLVAKGATDADVIAGGAVSV